jgi:hypothetical protein
MKPPVLAAVIERISGMSTDRSTRQSHDRAGHLARD